MFVLCTGVSFVATAVCTSSTVAVVQNYKQYVYDPISVSLMHKPDASAFNSAFGL